MTLPLSNNLSVSQLNGIFKNTVATFKFYWFLGILHLSVKKDLRIIDIWDIMVEMIVAAWYPVTYFNLSFGKSDSLHDAILTLQKVYNLPINISQADLRQWLHDHKNDSQLRALFNFLPLHVPYRFLRPWIDTNDNRAVVRRSQSFENGCLYRLNKKDDTMWIEINSQWIPYLKEHYVILTDFARWNLANFLQVRNPHVPNIIDKIVKVETRQPLTKQHNYWDFVLQHDSTIKCIYTHRPLAPGAYDLDHFVPWRFVSHDLVWNLIPSDPSVNSSKSDRIPPLETFLPPLATLQQKAVQTCIRDHYSGGALDDYVSLGCSAQELAAMDKEQLLDTFRRTYSPLCQLALNMGFELWNR